MIVQLRITEFQDQDVIATSGPSDEEPNDQYMLPIR